MECYKNEWLKTYLYNVSVTDVARTTITKIIDSTFYKNPVFTD